METDFYGTGSMVSSREAFSKVESTFDRHAHVIALPPLFSSTLLSNPQWIGFTIARHKFVGKMFEGMENVLEVGCWEGMGSVFVAQYVKHLTSIDFYIPFITAAQKCVLPHVNNIDFIGHDIMDGAPALNKFDGAFSLDILEHIDKDQEDLFIGNISNSLSANGVLIIGSPALESQMYAGVGSRRTHINCKTSDQLSALCKKFFSNVFMFGMNDEVLHTGFGALRHYNLALCTSRI